MIVCAHKLEFNVRLKQNINWEMMNITCLIENMMRKMTMK